MDSVTLLRQQFKEAHEVLEATMADVTPEQAQWLPPGLATPLGASYAHAIVSDDMLVNGVIRGAAPLFTLPDWAGKTGLSEPMPFPGPDWVNYGPWTRRVQVDLEALRQYSQGVYASTGQYLASLQPEDLDRVVDMSRMGMGQPSLGWFLSTLVVLHAANLCGEISCLKGLQGARGYPF
jgi:hypothetical protein